MKYLRLNKYRYVLEDTATHKKDRVDNIVTLKKTVITVNLNAVNY